MRPATVPEGEKGHANTWQRRGLGTAVGKGADRTCERRKGSALRWTDEDPNPAARGHGRCRSCSAVEAATGLGLCERRPRGARGAGAGFHPRVPTPLGTSLPRYPAS